MKNLSYWGLMNPGKSIAIIAVCQTVLTGIAVYAGVWLFARDVMIPVPVYYIGLTLFFLTLIFYPIRRARHKIWKQNYRKQKILDGLMVVSYMLTAVSVANSDAHIAWRTPDEGPHARQIVQKSEENVAPAEKKWSRKEIRKELKHRFKEYVSRAKAKAGSGDPYLGKIIGMILLTILLMILVMFLACGVACSGAEAGGLVILIGGWALVLFLGISTVRRLKRKRRAGYGYQPMPQ